MDFLVQASLPLSTPLSPISRVIGEICECTVCIYIMYGAKKVLIFWWWWFSSSAEINTQNLNFVLLSLMAILVFCSFSRNSQLFITRSYWTLSPSIYIATLSSRMKKLNHNSIYRINNNRKEREKFAEDICNWYAAVSILFAQSIFSQSTNLHVENNWEGGISS